MRTRPDLAPAAPPALLRPRDSRLDAAAAQSFRREILAAAAAGEDFAVDLAGVAYIDVFGLEALLDGVRASLGSVTFVNVGPEARDFLRRNDLTHVLRLVPDPGPSGKG